MGNILISGAKIWDATGAAPFAGDVLVEGNAIRAVSQVSGQLSGTDCEVIDGSGMTLMPGLVEGHMHMTFDNIKSGDDLTLLYPEEHILVTLRQAKVMIDAGFTSCYSGASSKLLLEIIARKEINAGRYPGPRLRAATPEITVSGGLGDEDLYYTKRDSFALKADGVDEMTKLVRIACREGVDNVKLNISGDPFKPSSPAESTPMTQREVDAAAEAAHAFNRNVNAHARSAEAIKRALRANVDVLYHCEYADEEALDMLEAHKDRIFVAPTVSLFHTMLNEASEYGMTREVATHMGMQTLLEWSCKTHGELRKRGIRHVIGGDYGFAWSHHGTNARDIGFFVEYFGYTPAEALRCATAHGGKLMTMRSDENLGTITEGALADMLLVNGDPVADPAVLLDHGRLALIMKDGQVHKNITHAVQRRAAA